MLAKSLSGLERAFICIDALDEFPADHRSELWESLQRIVLLDRCAWLCYGSGKDSLGDMQTERILENVL